LRRRLTSQICLNTSSTMIPINERQSGAKRRVRARKRLGRASNKHDPVSDLMLGGVPLGGFDRSPIYLDRVHSSPRASVARPRRRIDDHLGVLREAQTAQDRAVRFRLPGKGPVPSAVSRPQ
jgi:hypothetical protein